MHCFLTTGDEPPVIPSGVTTRDVGYNSATIEWTMRVLSCAMEMLVVRYGEGEILDKMVELSSSGMDTSQEDVEFSAKLTGLSSCTQYHYIVLVTNAEGESASGEFTFTTVSDETGMQLTIMGMSYQSWLVIRHILRFCLYLVTIMYFECRCVCRIYGSRCWRWWW